MKMHNLATWAMFATAALLFGSALPTAQASLYNDAFNVVCSKLDDQKKKDCERIRDRGCAAAEGPEGIHPVVTGELYKAAKAIREKGRGLPVAPVTHAVAGVVDEAAKNESGVKIC